MNPAVLRDAFLSSIAAQQDGLPEAQYIYLDAAHIRALHPDHTLVRGIRGAGKSVLFLLMQRQELGQLLAALYPYERMPADIRVRPGFGEQPDPARYPGRDTLEHLLERYEPRLIWRTVLLHSITGQPQGLADWTARVQWVRENPESVERRLKEEDQRLSAEGALCLVVFDALDRTAATWEDRARLLDGLLQNLLDFRAYRSLRAKAFVRPDMLIDRTIGRFPDASKVVGGAVDLLWTRTLLFGLLWKHLLNAPQGGDAFRVLCESEFLQEPRQSPDLSIWFAPSAMNAEEDLQRPLFHALAGEWMGADKRRGYPYTWLPNHLADALQQVSPRSFLVALREAAHETALSYAQHPTALHPEAIKRGVQKASKIRVEEMAEDFPWLGDVMAPLKNLIVPCEQTEIAARWEQAKLKERLDLDLRGVVPRRSGEFGEGLCEQLVAAGIFARMPDGRINLPDVYRVGFGLRRLGGVKPLR